MDKAVAISLIKKELGIKKDSDFSRYLGIKPNVLSNWKKRNTLDYELIITKCEFLDANWLITGNGSMLKKEQKNTERAPPTEIKCSNCEVLEDRLKEKDQTIKDLRDSIKTKDEFIEILKQKAEHQDNTIDQRKSA